MPTLPPHLADLADELRAEFAAQGGHEKVLVEQLVAAALRLRLLHEDPRLYLPHTVDRTWDRDHDLASRNYHRAYRALRDHRSSAPARPRVSYSQPTPAPRHTPPRPFSPAPIPAPAAVPHSASPPPSSATDPRRTPEHRPAPNPSPAQAPAPRPEPGPPSPHTHHHRHDKHRPKRLFPRPSANHPPASSPRASPP